MAAPSFKRLVRFVPKASPGRVLVGQPRDDSIDVGRAVQKGDEVQVSIFSGNSILNPGKDTGDVASIGEILSPLASEEVGTIRCIGLNYKQHAKEVGMALPKAPEIFMKPSTALAGPSPPTIQIPKVTQDTDTGDYESELVVVIGPKAAKNVSEAEALDYVWGYTAGNDVSSRHLQLSGSQWSFSKSFDGACPIGPTFVSSQVITDPSKLRIKGYHNGKTMQDCGIDDLIFGVPKLVSFLSQSTTLPPGTLIVTGTPAGVGFKQEPAVKLRDGDEFAVEILPHIGTLINNFQNE